MACKNNSEQSKIIEKENDLKEELKTQESEWQILFDGISYEQWRGYLAEDIPQEWIIEDGAMAFIPGSEGGKNIITKDKFTNFILSLEWKISEGGNSGIFWGVYEDAKFPEAYQTGPEIQIVDNEKHPDAQYEGGTHKAGSLFDMIACPDSTVKPAGEWNLCVMEINHKTNLGKVIMNNIEVFTFPLHGDAWETMVANSKFKDWEGFGRYKTGHIGLQDHGNKVWFRNIKIKKL
ncbi:MAG: DUF1080 domain-containing protein [Bacteroidia bacterium]|nr:DUF1080 domain-containing protein [Bacteroidia bacterium]